MKKVTTKKFILAVGAYALLANSSLAKSETTYNDVAQEITVAAWGSNALDAVNKAMKDLIGNSDYYQSAPWLSGQETCWYSPSKPYHKNCMTYVSTRFTKKTE